MSIGGLLFYRVAVESLAERSHQQPLCLVTFVGLTITFLTGDICKSDKQRILQMGFVLCPKCMPTVCLEYILPQVSEPCGDCVIDLHTVGMIDVDRLARSRKSVIATYEVLTSISQKRPLNRRN